MQRTRRKSMMRTPSRTRSVTWKAFLDRLAANLGHGAAVVKPKPMLVWRDGAALNHLQLRPWTVPDPRSPGQPPGVTRIAVNVMAFDPPQALLCRLGFESGARWPGRTDRLGPRRRVAPRSSRPVLLRRMEVTDAAPAERTFALAVSPSGLRIEGLTIADVIAILRGLA